MKKVKAKSGAKILSVVICTSKKHCFLFGFKQCQSWGLSNVLSDCSRF